MPAQNSVAVASSPVDAERLRAVLIAALRAFPDNVPAFGEELERFASISDADAWGRLLAYASYHGVFGVLHAASANYPDMPAEIRAEADRRRTVEELWHAHISHELETVARLLSNAGIAALALKGPALAKRVYPSAAMRHCMDLDLLVEPGEFERAAALLTAAGYASETGVSASYLRQHGHHLTFTKAGSVPIELHFQSYAGFGCVVPAHALLARAVSMPLADTVAVRIPAPEDEFLYLAIHAAGHSFVRLVWLYDLKLLLRRHPSFAWDELARRARDLHVGNAVAYSIRVLERWITGAIPRAPSSGAGIRAAVADRLLSEASRPHGVSIRDNLGGLIFNALLCDSAPRGVSLVSHHVGRALRRRLKRIAPAVLPEDWSA